MASQQDLINALIQRGYGGRDAVDTGSMSKYKDYLNSLMENSRTGGENPYLNAAASIPTQMSNMGMSSSPQMPIQNSATPMMTPMMQNNQKGWMEPMDQGTTPDFTAIMNQAASMPQGMGMTPYNSPPNTQPYGGSPMMTPGMTPYNSPPNSGTPTMPMQGRNIR